MVHSKRIFFFKDALEGSWEGYMGEVHSGKMEKTEKIQQTNTCHALGHFQDIHNAPGSV